MLRFLEQWQARKARRKLLLEFYEELRKNLESYYVMDQLARFRFFRMETWAKLKSLGDRGILEDAMIVAYVRRLEEYNSLLGDFTKFEQWYSDLNNKTPANARILHDKREEPRKKFEGLEGVIKSAVQSFEKYLYAEKIFK